MKTFLKIVALSAIIGSQASAWWLNDATITSVIATKNGSVGIALKSGTNYYNVNFPEAYKKEMMAVALTAMSSGKTVNADIASGWVNTIVLKP